MRGAPSPEIRIGSLVIDERFRPAVVVDDEVHRSVRTVRLGGILEEVWAADLIITDESEFEMALALREMQDG